MIPMFSTKEVGMISSPLMDLMASHAFVVDVSFTNDIAKHFMTNVMKFALQTFDGDSKVFDDLRV